MTEQQSHGRHRWAVDKKQVGSSCMDCGLSQSDWFFDEQRRLTAGLDVEHEIQRQMLARLGIEWTPGEPFYSLIEAEIERLRAELAMRTDLYSDSRWKEE